MKNIVIYTTQKQSEIKDTLDNLDVIEDSNVRIEDATIEDELMAY